MVLVLVVAAAVIERDGTLLVVNRALTRAVRADGVAARLEHGDARVDLIEDERAPASVDQSHLPAVPAGAGPGRG